MIFKYDIINPVINNKRPFYNNKKGLFLFNTIINYKYYIEVSSINETNSCKEYFILISINKFDNNCRICHVDSYGRCQIRIRGEIKDYIIKETKDRGNIDVNYIESTASYDVYQII